MISSRALRHWSGPAFAFAIRSARLTCRFAVRGRDWRAWIVPEALAVSAGPALLQSAIEDGLGAHRIGYTRIRELGGLRAASKTVARRGKVDTFTFVVSSTDGTNFYLINTGKTQNV